MSRRPTHAGGVVYRMRDSIPEFLAITSSRTPAHWVLPKGHIERNESPEQAAVREVEEEAGVLARVHDFLDEVVIEVNGAEQRIHFFLMSAVEEGRPRERREMSWLVCEAAVERLTFDNARELVQRASRLLVSD